MQRGFWQQDGRGQYQIVQYLAHVRSAEQILTDRAHNAADKARRSQHAAGDHSLCVDPRHCPAIREAHAKGDHSLCDSRFCKYLSKGQKATAPKPVPKKETAGTKEEKISLKEAYPRTAPNPFSRFENIPGLRKVPYDSTPRKAQDHRMHEAAVRDGYANPEILERDVSNVFPNMWDIDGWEESGGADRWIDSEVDLLETEMAEGS